MFCKNCGTEMSDNARFCPKCGFERAGAAERKHEIVEDNVVVTKLKPVYKFAYKFISIAGKALLWTIIFCFWFTSDNLDIWVKIPELLLIPTVILVLYVVIKMILDKKQYNKLEYNFYKTKVEYIDGFLNKEEKELKYKHIREVTMTQNILERMFKLGTIRVFTNASSGGYNYNRNSRHTNMMGKNGIFIHCIENVQENYKRIKEIIDEGTPEEND